MDLILGFNTIIYHNIKARSILGEFVEFIGLLEFVEFSFCE